MKKNSWILWLVVAASVITIIASASSAIANVEGFFGKKNDDTTKSESSKTAQVQVIDYVEA